MSTAVITPWLDHPELWDDYERAIELGPPPDELIVVDNGSDPPHEFAQIRNDTNQGFCKANNQGLAAATAEVVVFLNNDVWASAHGWLEELTDAVEPGVLAGAQMRGDAHADVDGQRHPYLDGWCLAGRRQDFVDLGGWDETLEEPAYYSDNLLCFTAQTHGMRLRRQRVGVHHKTSVTARTTPDLQAATLSNRARYEHRVRALLEPAHTA